MKNKLQIPFVGIVEIDLIHMTSGVLNRLFNDKPNVKIVINHEDTSVEMLKFFENPENFLVGKWEKLPDGTFDLIFAGIISKYEVGKQKPTKKTGFFKKLLNCCY